MILGKMAEYESYDALGLADLVRRKEVKPEELLDEALARAERLNPKLNAIVHAVPDKAQALIRDGLPDGPFTGVPFLLKDLGCEAIGYPTDMGSRFYANYQWTFDSEIYLRMKQAGLVAFARTTSPELGVSPATEARGLWRSDAQSLEPESYVRRLQRRQRRGGRRGHRAAGPWQRWRRLGAHPRLLLRPVRAEADAGTAARRAGLRRGLGRHVDRRLALAQRARHARPCWMPARAPISARPTGRRRWRGPIMEEIKTPPRRLRIAMCRTTLHRLGDPCRVRRGGGCGGAKLCADLGHELVEAKPSFDFEKVVRAWTKVVLCGTALSVQMGAQALGPQARQG